MKVGYALGLFVGLLSPAASVAPKGVTTVDQCSRNPELFHMSQLSAPEAERLFRRIAGGGPRLERWLIEGYAVAGACGKYIVTGAPPRFSLSNGAAFVAQVPPYRLLPVTPEPYLPRTFSPSSNLRRISGRSAGIKGQLDYVDSQDTGSGLRVAIWSGRRGSVVGTIECPAGGAPGPCSMGQVFLASPYQIRRLSYTPMPHRELNGSIALWFALPGGRQAFVDYAISGVNRPTAPLARN